MRRPARLASRWNCPKRLRKARLKWARSLTAGRWTIESAIAPVPEKRLCPSCIDIALQQADRADLPAASTLDRRHPLRHVIGLSHIISLVSAQRDPRRFLRTKNTRETP
ncbi:MAG: hypothetical protein KJZ98_08680 [Burkholderiaceae bacterium]|jgi:hypothetical protein|nr:hypothetical protein [Burkholderiaceae bacterium]MEB2352319.1 hypothetical protein [Burkholderiaceae bacterium]